MRLCYQGKSDSPMAQACELLQWQCSVQLRRGPLLAKRKEKTEEAAAPAPVVEAPPPAPKPQTKSSKIPKLAPKNKSRLPRRVKKAQKKAAGRL
jgi:hypothetical protein